MARMFHLGLLNRRDRLGDMSRVTSDLGEKKDMDLLVINIAHLEHKLLSKKIHLFIPQLKAEVSLLLHDTCDRTLILEKWLVLIWCVVRRCLMRRGVVKRRILTR